jgi:hypothetical protein
MFYRILRARKCTNNRMRLYRIINDHAANHEMTEIHFGGCIYHVYRCWYTNLILTFLPQV